MIIKTARLICLHCPTWEMRIVLVGPISAFEPLQMALLVGCDSAPVARTPLLLYVNDAAAIPSSFLLLSCSSHPPRDFKLIPSLTCIHPQGPVILRYGRQGISSLLRNVYDQGLGCFLRFGGKGLTTSGSMTKTSRTCGLPRRRTQQPRLLRSSVPSTLVLLVDPGLQ